MKNTKMLVRSYPMGRVKNQSERAVAKESLLRGSPPASEADSGGSLLLFSQFKGHDPMTRTRICNGFLTGRQERRRFAFPPRPRRGGDNGPVEVRPWT